MSSGVPPSPPVTIRWSTRARSRRTNSTIRSVSSGTAALIDDLARRAPRAAARATRRSCSRCRPRRARSRSSGWRRAHGEYDHQRRSMPDRDADRSSRCSVTPRTRRSSRNADGVAAPARGASRARAARRVGSRRSTDGSSGARRAALELLRRAASAPALEVRVAPTHRRRGIGTALYDVGGRRTCSTLERRPRVADDVRRERRRASRSRARAAGARSAPRALSTLDPRTVDGSARPHGRARAGARARPARPAPDRRGGDARHAGDRGDRRHPVRRVAANSSGQPALHARRQLRRRGRRTALPPCRSCSSNSDSGAPSTCSPARAASYRGRGLGLAVKLASIRWAAANGITQMVTTNDETNAPMLAINRRLGYAPGAAAASST